MALQAHRPPSAIEQQQRRQQRQLRLPAANRPGAAWRAAAKRPLLRPGLPMGLQPWSDCGATAAGRQGWSTEAAKQRRWRICGRQEQPQQPTVGTVGTAAAQLQ